jgi:hypothetical protein
MHCKEANQKHIQYWKSLPKCRHSKIFLKELLTRAAGIGDFQYEKISPESSGGNNYRAFHMQSVYKRLKTESNM